MNILFVFSIQDAQSVSKPLQHQDQIQFGISYISSYLKEAGHNIKLLVLTRGSKINLIDEYIKKFSPGLIGFTAVSSEYQFISNIAMWIKGHYPNIFLIVGGPHVSLNPETSLTDDFDALCIGEGEKPMLELVEQLENGITPSSISNLWIKHGSDIEKNSPRQFLENLDSLPFPDRKMWQDWIDDTKTRNSILLGRGCIFQCTYCCNHALRKLAKGSYVRIRSSDNILKELKEIEEQFQAREVYLEIESFGVNMKWAIELCEKLENFNKKLNQPLSFGVNLRITPNTNYENLFTALKKSNFRFINIGLESGSERIRREILKRNYSNQDIINAVKLARKYNLKICFFNLIGIPGETISDFKETVKINRICLPDWHWLSIFFPYPGTDLYVLCKKQGLLENNLDTEMERSKATLNLVGFTKKQIQKSYIWFDYYVYKGYKPIYKILSRIIVSKFKSNYYLNHFYRKLTGLVFLKYLKDFLKQY